MSDGNALEERLTAVERAITDCDQDLTALSEPADVANRLDGLESQVTELEDQLTELEASVQAVRGYVGNVRSVNRDVERRADAAIAKVETLEAQLAPGDEPVERQQQQRTDHEDDSSDRHSDTRVARDWRETTESEHTVTDSEQSDDSERDGFLDDFTSSL